MPIIGLTDRDLPIPRLGKIHLGTTVQHENGNTYPRATEHFVFEVDHEDADRRAAARQLAAIYGDAPTQLPIIFSEDAEELIADTWYKAYSSLRSLVCKGDGNVARRLVNPDALSRQEDGRLYAPIAAPDDRNVEWVSGIVCPGEECEYYGRTRGVGCRRIMSLQIMLPEAPGIGTYQIDTTSIHSILNVYAALRTVRRLFKRVAGIPLTLSLEPKEVAPDGRKKTVRVLNIRSQYTLLEMAAGAQRHVAMLSAGATPAPSEEPDDLLYPTVGFAPGDVDNETGEIRKEPFRAGHHHVQETAPVAISPNSWEAIQAVVEGDGLIEWLDFGNQVLHSSARNFKNRCDELGLDVFDEANRLYSAFKDGLILDAEGRSVVDRDPPLDWVDDTDPVAAMAEVFGDDDGSVIDHAAELDGVVDDPHAERETQAGLLPS